MRHRTTRPDRKYAAIPNEAMRDERLSIEARGLLALLMTYSDDWVFRRDHLMTVAGIGRDKFQNLMRELTEAGYVRRVSVRGEGGKLSGSQWQINDEPDRGPESQAVGSTEGLKNRPPVTPAAGKSGPLRRSTGKKTNLEEGTKAAAADLRLPSLKVWKPSDELRRWAWTEGFTDHDIDEQTDLFRFFYRDKPLKDPDFAWRKWMKGDKAKRLGSAPKAQRSKQREEVDRWVARIERKYGPAPS